MIAVDPREFPLIELFIETNQLGLIYLYNTYTNSQMIQGLIQEEVSSVRFEAIPALTKLVITKKKKVNWTLWVYYRLPVVLKLLP